MAVGRTETALVLGLIGISIVGGSAGLYWLSTIPPTKPNTSAPAPNVDVRIRPSPITGLPSAASPSPEPFIATMANEMAWRPDVLPPAWPQFSKLPYEQPLPAKPTKAKLDNARALIAKWDAYKAGKSKVLPRGDEPGEAIKYLLSIERSDPQFPEAWALFIKLRILDREHTDEVRAIALRAADADRKREAKKHGVTVGMTAEEIIGSSWGKPTKVNVTVNAYGRHEQWIYPGYNYLYVDNGILTSIQTSR